jgi:hypothetical protein
MANKLVDGVAGGYSLEYTGYGTREWSGGWQFLGIYRLWDQIMEWRVAISFNILVMGPYYRVEGGNCLEYTGYGTRL